jgi:uncharacterized protein YjbI with pentapeptide repeats
MEYFELWFERLCFLWRDALMKIYQLQVQKPFKHLFRGIAATIVLTAVSNSGTIAQAENLDHIRQLLATKECQRCDLQGASLVMANLQSANVQGANFQSANLSRVIFAGADLRNAKLAGASLSGANLGGADLTGADLRNTDLRGTIFTGAVLTNTKLDGAALQGAIDLPSNIGTAEQYYQWATESTRQKRYDIAIEQFTQALTREPLHAPSYLGRSIAQFEIGKRSEAIADMTQANELFKTKGDRAGIESSDKLLIAMKKPPESNEGRGGNGLGMGMMNAIGGLLRLFLMR